MSDNGREDLDGLLDENENALGDYSLMDNGDPAAGSVSSSTSDQELLSKINKLAEGQQLLIDVLTQYLQAQKEISAASLPSSSSFSASSTSTICFRVMAFHSGLF